MTKNGSGIFVNLVINHPWITLLVALLVLGSFSQNLVKVRPSVSYQDLLGKDHPKLIDYEKIQSEYTRDDNLLVLIEASDGNAFDSQTLATTANLTERLWQTPFSIRVDSISNFQHSYAVGDELIVGDLVPENAKSRTASQVRDIAMIEPILINRATNGAGNVVAASVSFAFPNKDASEKLDAYDFVVKLADEFEQLHPELNLHISGLVALDATVMEISQREMGLFLVLVIGIVIVLLAVFMRSVVPVVLSILICLFSIVMALSLAGFMGWKLTPFTASVPLIILIIAVADCVHIVTAYLQQLRENGEKKPALEAALRANLKPVAITSITTAIGFLTLNFSESDSIHALGNQVAFGVLAAFFFSITFLPASLSILPSRSIKSNRQPRSHLWADNVAAYVDKFRLAILGISAIAIVGIGMGINKNVVNDIIPHYFAETLAWRQANDFAEQEFGGAYTFSWSLQARDKGGVSDPQFLLKASQFVTWLRAKPEVVYVNSVTDTFKRLNRNMNEDNPEFYRLPDNQALASQYLLLYEMSLPYGLDLNNQINLEKSAIRIQATFKTLSTSDILAMEKNVQDWLSANIPEIDATGSGVQLMFAHMLNNDVFSMLYGTTLGLFVISLLLIVAFRSFRIGLVSLVPNLVPALMAFGVWGMTVGQVGMGLAMVSGMSIGIIVDDTVHFLYKYLLARRDKKLAAKDAIAYAYRTVGPAIIFTTTVLVAGFMAMTFLAEFRVNSDMAIMTSMVLVFALVIDLIALPALLILVDSEKQTEKSNLLSQQTS